MWKASDGAAVRLMVKDLVDKGGKVDMETDSEMVKAKWCSLSLKKRTAYRTLAADSEKEQMSQPSPPKSGPQQTTLFALLQVTKHQPVLQECLHTKIVWVNGEKIKTPVEPSAEECLEGCGGEASCMCHYEPTELGVSDEEMDHVRQQESVPPDGEAVMAHVGVAGYGAPTMQPEAQQCAAQTFHQDEVEVDIAMCANPQQVVKKTALVSTDETRRILTRGPNNSIPTRSEIEKWAVGVGLMPRINALVSIDISHGYQLTTTKGGCVRVFTTGTVDIAGSVDGKNIAVEAFKTISGVNPELSRAQKKKARKGVIG